MSKLPVAICQTLSALGEHLASGLNIDGWLVFGPKHSADQWNDTPQLAPRKGNTLACAFGKILVLKKRVDRVVWASSKRCTNDQSIHKHHQTISNSVLFISSESVSYVHTAGIADNSVTLFWNSRSRPAVRLTKCGRNIWFRVHRWPTSRGDWVRVFPIALRLSLRGWP